MTDPHWQSTHRLSAAALDNVYGINRIFLDTLAASAPPRLEAATQPLSGRIAIGVAALNPERRRAFARNPFSLFDARFGDGRFWTQLTNTVREPAVCGIGGSGAGLSGFSQLGLFYAWHVARADPLAARVVLGMCKKTREIFMQLTLPYLQQLALVEPQLIVPRWSDRATVWQIFLGAAQLGAAHLAEVRMFGIQLIAGDLAAAPDD